MAAPSVDGTAEHTWASGSSASVNLTTTSANNVIIVGIALFQNHGAGTTVSSVTSSGLTFTKRVGTIVDDSVRSGADFDYEYWWAPSTGILTSQTISITSSASINTGFLTAFGVAGAYNITNPWDSYSSLPFVQVSTVYPHNTGSIITNQANSLVLGFTAAYSASTTMVYPYAIISNPDVIGMGTCISGNLGNGAGNSYTIENSPGVLVASIIIGDAITGDNPATTGTITTNLKQFSQILQAQVATTALIYTLLKGYFNQVLLGSVAYPPPYTAGPIPVFPQVPYSLPIKLRPTMKTIIGKDSVNREVRFPQQTFPLWEIELLFEELRDQTQNQILYEPFLGYTQYEDLVLQWLLSYGKGYVFAFDAPWDDSRADQPLGTGDGLTTVFTAVRQWGQAPLDITESVGQINLIYNVKINGTIASPLTYTVGRNQITFLSPPGSGLPITMTFSFYYLCHFMENQQEFTEFSENRWEIKSLKMRSIYWPE